jgi:hypothetical protein
LRANHASLNKVFRVLLVLIVSPVQICNVRAYIFLADPKCGVLVYTGKCGVGVAVEYFSTFSE